MNTRIWLTTLLLIGTTACTKTELWTDNDSLSNLQLWAWVDVQDDAAIKVWATLALCDQFMVPVEFEEGDRLEAVLGSERIELKRGFLPGPFSPHRGAFSADNSSNQLWIDLVRPGGGGLERALEVEVPSLSLLVSPDAHTNYSRSNDGLEFRWEPLAGASSDRLGADELYLEIESSNRCSVRGPIPTFREWTVDWSRDAASYILPEGTLALPALSGGETCMSRYWIERTNIGLARAELCDLSEIEITRRTRGKYRSTP